MRRNAIGLDVLNSCRLNWNKPVKAFNTFNLATSDDALRAVNNKSKPAIIRQVLTLCCRAEVLARVEDDCRSSLLPIACGHDRVGGVGAVVSPIPSDIHIFIGVVEAPLPQTYTTIPHSGVLASESNPHITCLEVPNKTCEIIFNVNLSTRIEENRTTHTFPLGNEIHPVEGGAHNLGFRAADRIVDQHCIAYGSIVSHGMLDSLLYGLILSAHGRARVEKCIDMHFVGWSILLLVGWGRHGIFLIITIITLLSGIEEVDHCADRFSRLRRLILIFIILMLTLFPFSIIIPLVLIIMVMPHI